MLFIDDAEYAPIQLDRRLACRRPIDNASTRAAALRGRGSDRPVGTFGARILDLSARGMKIESESPVLPGHAYWFRLDLPGHGASVRVRGQVAWTCKSGPSGEGCTAGIAFLALSEERAQELCKALRTLG